MLNKIRFDPVTLRECFGYWFFWRFTAAHKFCLDCMRTGIKTRSGNQNILHAPTSWYFDRFVAAWRLGKPWIIRSRREMRR